jgi:hypothetical protein
MWIGQLTVEYPVKYEAMTTVSRRMAGADNETGD